MIMNQQFITYILKLLLLTVIRFPHRSDAVAGSAASYQCMIYPELCVDLLAGVLPQNKQSSASPSPSARLNETKTQQRPLLDAASFQETTFDASSHDTPDSGAASASALPVPPPKNWTVTVVKVPGLTADTVTHTVVNGVPTDLPVYFNSTGVGIIIVPVVVAGVVLAGAGATGPPPLLPIYLNENGEPIFSEAEQQDIQEDTDNPDPEELDRPNGASMTSSAMPSGTAAQNSGLYGGSSTMGPSSAIYLPTSAATSPSSPATVNPSQYTIATSASLSLNNNRSMPTGSTNASIEMVPDPFVDPANFWNADAGDASAVAQSIQASIDARQLTQAGRNCSRVVPPTSTATASQTDGIQLLGSGQATGFDGNSKPGPSATPAPQIKAVSCGEQTANSAGCPLQCPWKYLGKVDPGNGSPTQDVGECISPPATTLQPSTPAQPPPGNSLQCTGINCNGVSRCSAGCNCVPQYDTQASTGMRTLLQFSCAAPGSKRLMHKRSLSSGTYKLVETEGCLCNRTYISEKCCSSRSGIVYEPSHRQLFLPTDVVLFNSGRDLRVKRFKV